MPFAGFWGNNMRFVIVGTAFPMRGGIAQYVALLYQTLIQAGHYVHVLSFKRQYPELFFPGKTQEDEGKELISIQSTPLLDSINPLTWIKAFLWLKKVRPDALVFKYWMPFFAPCYAVLGGLAKWKLGIRLIYICDNIIPHEKKPGEVLLTKLGLRFVDGFIAQSASVRRDLLSMRPDALYMDIPHPVYTIFPEAISKTDARRKLRISEKSVILYFGFIRAYKGLKYLIQAMPGILEKINVRCVICGEFYEGRDETFSLIHELGLDSHVTVEDRFTPNEMVNQFFCAADLVVLPYVTATQSGVVQVAYHYNRPVVVTRVGGLPEVVLEGKTGYVIPPENPAALQDAVLRYYKDEKTTDFEAHIEKEKQKYSWERMGEAVARLAQKQFQKD